MGPSSGRATGAQQSEINVTPMIDVLLVLLIIFMVVQQGLQSGLSVQLPPTDPIVEPSPEQLVLSVQPGGDYQLNSVPIAAAQLTPELRRVFAARTRKVLFVDGSEHLTYGEVIHAVDASRAAGVEIVGLIPRADVTAP
jgi:biopolymer transport protein TolR